MDSRAAAGRRGSSSSTARNTTTHRPAAARECPHQRRIRRHQRPAAILRRPAERRDRSTVAAAQASLNVASDPLLDLIEAQLSARSPKAMSFGGANAMPYGATFRAEPSA